VAQDWLKILGMWSWEPSILIGLACFLAAYLAVIGPLRNRFKYSLPVNRSQIIWFILGVFFIFLALCSPLDDLSDDYLFSAHMLQHTILIIIVPPFLLLGTPGWLIDSCVRHPMALRVARFFTNPISAYFIFNGIFSVWHFPAFYEAALDNQTVHIFEHLCFMVTGVLNWWPILSSSTKLPRISYPAQMLYLFLESIPSTILGALIVFSPTILYPFYENVPRILGISVSTDQQIAGLIMAMPAGMVYLMALTVIFFTWSNKEQQGILKQSA